MYNNPNTIIDIFDSNLSQNENINKYSIQNVHDNYRILDKHIKSQIFLLTKTNAKIMFTNLEDRQLCYQYLYVQMYVFANMDWCIEIQLSDQNKIKRRIIISTKITKQQIKLFYIKYPYRENNNNCWVNLAIDLWSFMRCFNDQMDYIVDSVTISGVCKLRRVFQAQQIIHKYQQQSNFNKNYCFPVTIKVINQIIKYKQLNTKSIQISDLLTKKQIISRQKIVLPSIGSLDSIQNIKNIKKAKSSLHTRLPQINHSQAKLKDKNLLFSQKINLISQSQRLDKNLVNGQNKGKQNRWIKRRLLSEANTNLLIQKDRQNREISQTRYQAVTPKYKKKNIIKNTIIQPGSKQYLEKSQKFSSLILKKPIYSHEQIQQDLQYENSILHNEADNKQQSRKIMKIPQLQFKKSDVTVSSEQIQLEPRNKQQNPEIPKCIKKDSYESFGQKLIQKCMKQINGSYSPQYKNLKLTDTFNHQQSPKIKMNNVQLIYDPILQCYYDGRCQNFYQLKK